MQQLAARVNATVDNALVGFVQAETVGEALKLGLVSGKNVLFHGAGGYGKSEMTESVLRQLGSDVRVWTSQLHIESTVSSLYGGLDMRALRETGEERYRVRMSILTADVAVLEEMLDAPPAVLASLKTLFTAGKLLNGGQSVESQCKLAIALTNRTPEEISSLGRSEAATLERFPIQVEVTWSEDTAERRLELYHAVYQQSTREAQLAERLSRADLAELPKMVKAIRVTEEYLTKKAAFTTELRKLRQLSPRMDIWADQLGKASAFLAGRSQVELDDLRVLRYMVAEEAAKVAEFDKLFFQCVEFTRKLESDSRFLDQIEEGFNTLQNWNYHNNNGDPVVVVAKAKEARAMKAKLQGHSSLEQNKDRRKQLLDNLEQLSSNMLLSLAA